MTSYHHRMVVTRVVAAAVLAALTACAGGSRTDGTAALPEDYAAQVQAWRDKHEADYRRDFVTIAGLHFLDPGRHTIGRAPGNDITLDAAVPATIGRLIVEADGVRFEAASGITVRQKDQPVPGPVTLKAPGQAPADAISIGAVRLAVHLTGGRLALRVRDPEGALARAFTGFSWFPIDASYRVVGRFVPDAAPRKLPVVNTFNGVDEYDTEGVEIGRAHV